MKDLSGLVAYWEEENIYCKNNFELGDLARKGGGNLRYAGISRIFVLYDELEHTWICLATSDLHGKSLEFGYDKKERTLTGQMN